MSVKAMNWVWEHSTSVGNDRLVLLAIADRCNDEGEDAWPAISTLMKKTRLSESTVRRSIKSLDDEVGELTVERRAGPNGVNRYRIRFEPRSSSTNPRKARTRAETRQPDTSQSDTSQDDGVSTPERSHRSGAERREVSLLDGKTSSTSNTSEESVPTSGTQSERRTSEGGGVRVFLSWWCDEYERTMRMKYRVMAQRDVPRVKYLLEAYGEAGIRKMAQRLFVERDDTFIVKSDRGIGVLSTKSNWLALRLTESKSAEPVAQHQFVECPHVVDCGNQSRCAGRMSNPERYPLREGVPA